MSVQADNTTAKLSSIINTVINFSKRVIDILLKIKLYSKQERLFRPSCFLLDSHYNKCNGGQGCLDC